MDCTNCKEIVRLHEMLLDAGIEHEWLDRTPEGYGELRVKYPNSFGHINWGWQIVIHDEQGNRVISAIEGYGTYGYADEYCPQYRGGNSDLIEIMGLLTPEEAEQDSVAGWLTAEDVFARIMRWRAEHER